ncbi:MAG: DUF2065 domain-containing protein [Pseudomonadota bacterium]
MADLGNHILLAIALIFVIEGLIYALFPSHIQNVMQMASNMPAEKFRYFGAAMLAFGVLCVWLIQKILT